MMSAMLREWKHPYYTLTITVWFIQTSPSNNMIVNLENNYLQVNETSHNLVVFLIPNQKTFGFKQYA